MIYVDKSSMERLGRSGRTAAWVWIIFRNDQRLQSRNYRSRKYRLVVDCEDNTAGSDSDYFYSAYGKLIHQDQTSELDMTPIGADTIVEAAAQFFCTGGKQPPRSLPVYDPNRDSEHRFHLRERESQPAQIPAPD